MTLNDSCHHEVPTEALAAVCPPKAAQRVETYGFEGRGVCRYVLLRDGRTVKSSLPNIADEGERDPHRAFDQSYLRSTSAPVAEDVRGAVRIVDLFSGAGGASLGINEACRAMALEPQHVFAADINEDALATYRHNFAPLQSSAEPIEKNLQGRLGTALTGAERAFRKQLGKIDLAVGGPPCQGHSNLNNHTRRDDPKNSLYDRMARFAEVVEPANLIIENVPGVRHDVGGVYDRTVKRLKKIGYTVITAKVEANKIGVPQRRHRELVVASRSAHVHEDFFEQILLDYQCNERPVSWAISDLVNINSDRAIDAVTQVSKESMRRINWLFDNGEYDLPDRLRPDCHKLNAHSYKSVYGRLYWEKPAWTITTGFQVMGQGRFLHPLERRVITSHEASRLQFVPDFFSFQAANRKGFAKMIGNAVPSKLTYVLASALLR